MFLLGVVALNLTNLVGVALNVATLDLTKDGLTKELNDFILIVLIVL